MGGAFVWLPAVLRDTRLSRTVGLPSKVPGGQVAIADLMGEHANSKQ